MRRAGVARGEEYTTMHWFAAYIDPGAGSLIVQATIAAILAIPYFFRRQIARAVRLVARRDRSSSGRPSTPKKVA
jgi:hypothetical protein